MGFRLFIRRWVTAAAAFVAPLMALGFYASNPESLAISVNAAISGVGSAHGRTVPGDAEAASRPRIAPEAEHLFASPFRGPRADKYLTLTRSERGLQPPSAAVTKVAKAPVQADMTVTGSIPKQDATPEALRAARASLPDDGPGPQTYGVEASLPVDESTSASLFLSMLSEVSLSSGENEENESVEALELPGQKKRLAFAGESETEYQARQRRCLATAIYFEARGEPIQGQKAVAQVVLNRVRSSLYPDTICGVVYQGQHRRTGCQFSFTCDGVADVPKDKERWLLANRLAAELTEGETFLKDIGHATHYHANYVNPRWRWGLNRIKKVGAHIFYRVRGEQIEDVLKEESPTRGLALSGSG